MDVRLPDGTVVRGVPDNITRAELIEKLERNGMDVSALKALAPAAAPAPEAPAPAPAAPRVDANGIPLDHDYTVPRKQAPAMSKETIGSLTGTVVGGGLGVLSAPLTGPFGAAAGATIGSALGAAAGAYLDATERGEDGNAAQKAALDAAGVDLMWSIGGGVVIKFGGKAVKFAAGSEVGEWVAKNLGFAKSAPTPQVAKYAEKAIAGNAVFPDTSPAEAARFAREAATGLQTRAQRTGSPGLAPSQITGETSWAERQARAQEGDFFRQAREGQESFLQEQVVALRDRIARADMSAPLARAATGQKLQRAIDATETAIKDKHRSTFEIISDPTGPLAAAGRIDVAPAIKVVDDELRRTANPEKIATLNELKKLLGDGTPIDLARANELLKEWGAEAASLDRLGKSDSPLQALYARMAADMRTKFNGALDAAAANGSIAPELRQAITAAKQDYSVMHKTLYSPTGSKLSRVAQTTPEDVLNVIAQKGATTEIGELRKIVSLAQSSGNNAAAVDARAALRELQATYFQRELPDAAALARLSERLRTDKAFADQFYLLMPESKGVRTSVERLAQAAKQVERTSSGGAANTGLVTGASYSIGGGVGSAIGFAAEGPVGMAVGGVVGLAVGGFTATQGRKILAHSLTKPSLRDAMPAVSAYALALSTGKKVGVPQAVQAWYDELKADGLITEEVPAAPAASEPAAPPVPAAPVAPPPAPAAPRAAAQRVNFAATGFPSGYGNKAARIQILQDELALELAKSPRDENSIAALRREIAYAERGR